MKLEDTIEMMKSEDYKERFKAEYYQTKIRYEKLHNMLTKLKAGKLEFEPKADTETLIGQAQIMHMYLNTLEVRALEEDIEIESRY